MILADSCNEINVFFVPWRILGDSRKHCGAFKWNQTSFWLTLAAKSMVLKRTLGDLWKQLGGLWKHLGALTCSLKLIFVYSCVEINGFRGALGRLWKHRGAFTWSP